MKRNEIEIDINVKGTTGSGKSVILYLVKDILMKNGFDVSQDVSLDYRNEQDFDNNISSKLQQAIDTLNKRTKINIKETQMIRENYE